MGHAVFPDTVVRRLSWGHISHVRVRWKLSRQHKGDFVVCGRCITAYLVAALTAEPAVSFAIVQQKSRSGGAFCPAILSWEQGFSAKHYEQQKHVQMPGEFKWSWGKLKTMVYKSHYKGYKNNSDRSFFNPKPSHQVIKYSNCFLKTNSVICFCVFLFFFFWHYYLLSG